MSSPVSYLSPAQLQRDLSIRDLSDPAEGSHAIQVLVGQAADARRVEEVRILSATACSQLPAPAIARLGAGPDQKNLLVRVVLRDLDRTLTNKAANVLRDRIYRALHRGTHHQWAT